MADVRQQSFGSGEVSPSLYGADDRDFYGHGARTVRNLIPSKARTLINRSGTVFCGEVKDSTKLTRLLPFNFSDDQAYALEVGEKYLRGWKSDGTQLAAEGLYALGGSGAFRSTDKGATWSAATSPAVGVGKAVCQAGGGRIVAVGNAAPYGAISDDGGATWLARTLPSPPVNGEYRCVVYNGHTIVAISSFLGDTRVAYSIDNGDTWVAASLPPASGMGVYGLAWGNGRWIAVGFTTANKARYCYSYDGDTWSAPQQIGNLDSGYFSAALMSVCFVNGQFVAVGRAGGGGGLYYLLWCRIGVLSSNWAWGVVGAGLGDSGYYLASVVTDGHIAVAVGGDAVIPGYPRAYKYNPVTNTWTDLVPSGTNSFNSVAYSRGYFVAVGSSRCARYDGTSWITPDPSVTLGAYPLIVACKGTELTEVTTPYDPGMHRELATCQSGDILTLFHRWFPPKELRRYGEYDWRLQDWYKTPPNLTVVGLAFVGTIDQTGDDTHPPKEWQWVVSWEDEESGRESLSSAALTPSGSGKIVLFPDKPVTIRWNVVVKASRYYVYRGRNGEWGFVGTVKQPSVPAGSSPSTVDFRDDGQTPVYSDSPRSWRNPFQSDLAYPSCGCYFDDRFLVGGSTVQPSAILGSAVADYYDFDENTVIKTADSLEFQLTARRFEEIRALVPLEKLLAFTSESEWVMGGAGGEALSYDSIFARARSNRGSSRVQPIVVGEDVVYVQAGGKVVRDFAYQAQSSEWGGKELSVLSQHLLEGYEIVDMAYAKEPLSVIWLVRSDGALLSLTLLREYKIWAWARHDTGGDAVEAVTVVPNGSEDVLFMVVKRTINGATKRYVERLATRSPASVATGVFLDCAKTYVGAATNTVTGLSHLEARTVGVLADGTYRGTYTVASGSITFTGAAATTVVVGLPITADFESLDYPEGRVRKKIVAKVGIEYRLLPATTDPGAGVYVGPDLNHLGDVRRFSDAENDTIYVPVEGRYNPGGRCALRHTQPFPIELRGITRVITDGR